jgi:hypothetical protein
MRKSLSLASCAIVALSLTGATCIQVPNTRACSSAGSLLHGAICAESLTGFRSDLTWREYNDMLEPQPERECVPVPGTTICAEQPPADGVPVQLPERGGAICRSTDDENKIKTALEQACRKLGPACTYEVHLTIQALGVPK